MDAFRLTTYLCAAAVILLLGGAGLLAFSSKERWTIKIDPSCEDQSWSQCPRKVSESAKKRNLSFRVSGVVCFIFGMIALMSCCVVYWGCCGSLRRDGRHDAGGGFIRDEAVNLNEVGSGGGGDPETDDYLDYMDDYNRSGG